jgi:uncharacterized membrane protein YhaH (DUF805 family)
MDWGHLFFTFNGRINRSTYWLTWLVFAAIYLFFYFAADLTESSALNAISGMITIVIFISLLAVGVKRLHDRNKSGWYLALFYVVPATLGTAAMVIATFLEDYAVVAGVLGLAALAIGVWAFVELGCLRGTVGANQYGPDPLAAPSMPPTRTPA